MSQATQIKKLSNKPLTVAVNDFLIVVDQAGTHYIVTIRRSEDLDESKSCRELNCVYNFILKHTKMTSVVKYISKILESTEEGGEKEEEEEKNVEEILQAEVVEHETEYVISPLGLSDTYYYLARDGTWYKVFYENGEIRLDSATVSSRKLVRVANPEQIFRSFPPPGINLNLSAHLEVDSLIRELRELISLYVDAEKKYINTAAVWALLTYVRHAFIFSEYLHIVKSQFGAGGTTFAHVVASFSARATANLIDPTPAVLFRLAHHYKPTLVVDEIREDALSKERLELNKLLVENAFDVRNIIPRLESLGSGRAIVAYRPYANLLIVDTALKFSNLSAQRRAWRVSIKRTERVTDFDAVARAAQDIVDKLYGFSMTFPLAAQRYIATYRSMQGVGALLALRDYMRAIDADTSVVDDVYSTIKQQLDDAYISASAIDPSARIISAVNEIVEDALYEFKQTNTAPAGWHVESDKCIYIYLDKLISRVRSKLLQLRQIDINIELDERGRPMLGPKTQRQWYVVESDVEHFLSLKKMRLLLKMHYGEDAVAYVNKNLVFRVCTE